MIADSSPSKVLILTGGDSPERDISIATSESVASALQQLGIDHDIVLAEENYVEKLLASREATVIIAMHGGQGENGTVQGLLDSLGIAYCGSGLLASALCMNKVYTKQILESHGIKTPRGKIINSIEEIEFEIPFVIKPVSGGSTIATSIVKKKFEVDYAFESAKEECSKTGDSILVEEYIEGLELTVGILDGAALPVLEIESMTDFYDYSSKYKPGMSKHFPPKTLADKICRELQETAERAFRILGCEGMARVDFRYNGRQAYLLEINTIPGMTQTSLLPEAAQLAGIDFNSLVLRILESAKKKKKETE